VDSSLVHKKVERDDVHAYYVPATGLAEEHGLSGLANIILMGKMLALTGFCSNDTMKTTIEKIVPPRKQHLIAKNLEAVEIGKNT
jgi:2-oxoglutarate ferredoxin oxidoreductase subunit gamma